MHFSSSYFYSTSSHLDCQSRRAVCCIYFFQRYLCGFCLKPFGNLNNFRVSNATPRTPHFLRRLLSRRLRFRNNNYCNTLCFHALHTCFGAGVEPPSHFSYRPFSCLSLCNRYSKNFIPLPRLSRGDSSLQ